jgi:hypothetical protein
MKTCVYCGTVSCFEKDHLIPKSWRYTTVTVPSCMICNRAKGSGLFTCIADAAEHILHTTTDHPYQEGLRNTIHAAWARISFETLREAALAARRETNTDFVGLDPREYISPQNAAGGV